MKNVSYHATTSTAGFLRSLPLAAVVFAVGTAPVSTPAFASKDDDHGSTDATFCSDTAEAVLEACGYEVKDDYWIAIGNCMNVSDRQDRRECERDARAEQKEGKGLCKDQYAARLEVCELIGEDRYDPDFDPANFVDPLEIGGAVAANPYFPLLQGSRWVYEGGDETITVTVTEKTKLIEGVTCLVVTDVATVDDGVLLEETDDWYAQDETGNVWYCGEIARNYETFEGDTPEEPELVDIEGSWKAGRDRAKPGILMLASPQVGDAYRQEMSLGDAEDVAAVLSTTGTESTEAGFSCDGDCVVTRDFTPIEPGVDENKYYAPGIGLILETDMEGNRVELTEYTIPTIP